MVPVQASSLAVVAVMACGPALAHEQHTSPSPPATPGVEALEYSAPIDEERPQPPPLVIDPQRALVEHLHNKIVHFPIALGLAGALLLLLSYRWSQFGAGARLLLVLAALSAWMAVRSGHAQQEALEGGELGEWLKRHENFGKWTALALSLTAVVGLIRQARPVHWLLALIVIGLVSYTAFLGGILGHTPV
jgi:uncharacterized membrane protein